MSKAALVAALSALCACHSSTVSPPPTDPSLVVAHAAESTHVAVSASIDASDRALTEWANARIEIVNAITRALVDWLETVRSDAPRSSGVSDETVTALAASLDTVAGLISAADADPRMAPTIAAPFLAHAREVVVAGNAWLAAVGGDSAVETYQAVFARFNAWTTQAAALADAIEQDPIGVWLDRAD